MSKIVKSIVRTRCQEIPEFTIKIETSPEIRWLSIIKKYKSHLPSLRKQISIFKKSKFSSLERIKNIRPWFLFPFGKYLFPKDLLYCPNELKSELIGISEYTKEFDISYDDLLLFNTCISSHIKSVMYVNKGEHHYVLDLKNCVKGLKDLVINVQFKDGKNNLFKITTIVGFVGVLYGMNRAFSIALKNRKLNEYFEGPKNIICTLCHCFPIELLFRIILQKYFDVEDALKVLCDEHIIIPCTISLSDGKNVFLLHRNRLSCEKFHKSKFLFLVKDSKCNELGSKENDDQKMFEKYLKSMKEKDDIFVRNQFFNKDSLFFVSLKYYSESYHYKSVSFTCN